MKAKPRFYLVVGLVFVVAMGFMPTRTLASSHAYAPDFVVTNLNDSGAGSLRQAMLNAYAVGGENVITFTVSGAINLSSTLPLVGDHLVIDGGSNEVTISGGDLVRLLEIQAGINVTLVNLTFAHGEFSYGGAIYNQGSLRIENCRFTQNHADTGAAIYNSGSLVTLNSLFEQNTAMTGGGAIWNRPEGSIEIRESVLRDNRVEYDFGGAIYNIGEAVIDATEISGDYATNLGGGIYNQNTLTLTNSVVNYNSALQGGGIYNSKTGNLTILENSQVSHNTSGENGGGGIYNLGILNASHSVFDQNTANAPYGGGLFNESDGVVNLSDSQVTNNRVWMAGGGIYNLGEFSLLRSRMVENFAYDMGGAIFSLGHTNIIDSSIDSNSSWNYAGGVYSFGELFISGSAITNNYSWTGGGMLIGQNAKMVNSTVSSNYASGYGGGIENYGQFEITYSTIEANMVETGIGFGGGINSYGNLSIGNSIVANSPIGTNCSGTITVTGPNLSNDTSCSGFSVADPRLGPLQDNGGSTLTHALLAGSPAIDAANNNNCPATDQRGQPRPGGLSCDLGAFEASQVNLLIDINPKTSANLIDLTSNSAVPVAILSTSAFNAPQQIVQTSLTFGMTGGENSLLRLSPLNRPVCSAADINGDRLLDLVCHFKIKAAGFTCQATRGFLRATLVDGTLAVGSDILKITRCP